MLKVNLAIFSATPNQKNATLHNYYCVVTYLVWEKVNAPSHTGIPKCASYHL